MPDLDERVSHLESETQAAIHRINTGLHAQAYGTSLVLDAVNEVKADVAQHREETRQQIGEVKTQLAEITALLGQLVEERGRP